MIPDWLRVPSEEEWQAKAQTDFNFIKTQDVGLVDAVQAGWYRNDTGELFQGFPVTAEDVVVDVGCGGGGASMFCARQGAHVVFCDIEPGNVENLTEQIRQTSARAFQGVVTDCCPLPLESGFASRVISMEMLEHVEDPVAVLAELVRVGQSGALYLIAVPDELAEQVQKPFAPTQYFQHPNHIRIFGRDELPRLVEEAGLQIVQRSSYGFFWMLWMCMYWVCHRASGGDKDILAQNCTYPPYFPILDDFSAVWGRLMQLPEAIPMREALDKVLPKSQIIIARKPLE